jgi:adenylate cyclase
LQALRALWSRGSSQDRLQASIRQAELEGLQFAFYARLTAIVVVAVWLVPWLRDLYYGAYAFGFFVLGYLPYRLRHHPHAEAIKLGFIVLDVALVSYAGIAIHLCISTVNAGGTGTREKQFLRLW